MRTDSKFTIKVLKYLFHWYSAQKYNIPFPGSAKCPFESESTCNSFCYGKYYFYFCCFPMCHSSVCVLPVLLSDAETGVYLWSIFLGKVNTTNTSLLIIKRVVKLMFYQLGATERSHSLVSFFQPIIVKMVSGK